MSWALSGGDHILGISIPEVLTPPAGRPIESARAVPPTPRRTPCPTRNTPKASARARTPRFPRRRRSGRRPRTNKDWWPNQLDLSVLHHALAPVQSDGGGLRLRRAVQVPRRRGAEARPRRGDDEIAGLVAGRLRPLRAALHPHDVARRRHVPHRRRPRRRRRGAAALRSPQQLARQRQPRQGAAAALADQEEVRPEDLLGRPAGPGRQRGHGVDGLQDLRLRLRPSRRLGARGHLLGSRGHLARRRALQRRPRARQAARRRADGPHLRESRRARRQARSAGGRARHPRDLRPHGDERRGDGRAHRRRPHVRQDAWRGPAARTSVRSPRRPRSRSKGLGWKNKHGSGKGAAHDHQRPRGRVDQQPDEVGQRVPREPLQVRVGADDEPRRREAVDAEESRGAGHRAGCARSVQAARADDADDATWR